MENDWGGGEMRYLVRDLQEHFYAIGVFGRGKYEGIKERRMKDLEADIGPRNRLRRHAGSFPLWFGPPFLLSSSKIDNSARVALLIIIYLDLSFFKLFN